MLPLPWPTGAVKVATVCGFPSGKHTAEVKAFEAAQSVASGADEVDMVIDIGRLKAGDAAHTEAEIRAVREATPGAVLKVIIESAALTDDAVSYTHLDVYKRQGSLIALLVATAALYLWNLGASGYANSFYSAAAQAGSQDWKAWFFASLDSGNAITVDKPPASLWVMGLSVRLFGLSSWSILVPQALMLSLIHI